MKNTDKWINKKISSVLYWENQQYKDLGYIRCPSCHGSGFVRKEGGICLTELCKTCDGNYPPGWIKPTT